MYVIFLYSSLFIDILIFHLLAVKRTLWFMQVLVRVRVKNGIIIARENDTAKWGFLYAIVLSENWYIMMVSNASQIKYAVIKNDLFTQDIHIAIISVTTDHLDLNYRHVRWTLFLV